MVSYKYFSRIIKIDGLEIIFDDHQPILLGPSVALGHFVEIKHVVIASKLLAMVWMLDVCKWLVSLNFFVFGIICYLKEYDTVLDADEEHDHACVLVLSEVDAVGANALCALFWGQIKQFSHDRSLVDQSQVTFKVKSRKDIIEETFLILILNFGVAK